MKYFTKDYITFFQDLSKNNEKDWFHANKKRYEESVKKPFLFFITQLITELQNIETDLHLEAKKCISRINRDIRFAKDKSPYNLHLTAFLGRGGKKDKSIPGMAIRLSPEMLGIMGGSYGMDKDQLYRLRTTLSKDNTIINALLSEPNFKKTFGSVRGETMKRVPKEWAEAARLEPLILQKQFYFMGELKPSLIYSDELMPTLLNQYKIMKPVNDYIRHAIA